MKSLVATWRDAVRDSTELDRTAKLVAHTIGTYMNGRGLAFPSQDTIAAGASITDRAVYKATKTLERAKFLEVEWSRGRSSHRYTATLPPTANAVRRSEWATANGAPSTANGKPPTANAVRGKAVKAAESGERGRLSGAARRPFDPCMACEEPAPLSEVEGLLLCDECVEKREAA